MNHIQILKRAWKILWGYRSLWIFGIVLAITSSSFNGNGFNHGGNSTSRIQPRLFNFNLPDDIQSRLDELQRFFSNGIPADWMQNFIWIGVAFLGVVLVLTIVFTIGRYISQTALIRMVDGFESTGEKVSWKQGLRSGWSRTAWRLFLITVVVLFPIILGVFLLAGCVASLFVMNGVIGLSSPSPIGLVAVIGLGFLAVFSMLVISLFISLVIETIYRVCVLQDKGVFESIRLGWSMVRSHFKDVGLVWLILIGIRIGFFILLIPVVILSLGVGLVFGGGFALLLHFIAQASAGVTAGWIAAAIGGGFIFVVIMGIPILLLNGLRETYLSTVWTLTYRELNLLILQKSALPQDGETE